jgi:hypothetical protein
VRALITLAIALWCARAAADEYNHQNLLVGTRSAGMGGADVALADSVSGTYYNPAGVVDAPSRLVSVSLSGYRVDLSGFADISVSEQRAGRVTGFRFNSFPLSGGLATRLGDGAGMTDHVLSFNAFVEDYSVGGTRVDVRLPDVVDLYLRVRRHDQRTLRFSPGWAARRGAVSFGITPTYLLRVESVLVDTLTDVQDSVSYRLRDFQGATGALLGQAGMLVRTGGFRFGASLTSPGVALHGSAVGTELDLRTANPARVDAASQRKMQYRIPVRAAVGAAWMTEGATRVSAQATYHGPVSRYEVIPGLVQAQGRALVNWNAGVEVPWSPSTILRAGAFTNLAATPPPPGKKPERLDDPARLPHVSFYGATAGLTLLSGESSMDVSLLYQYGTGWVPSETSRGHDAVRGSVVMVMLGGTYAFTSATTGAP